MDGALFLPVSKWHLFAYMQINLLKEPRPRLRRGVCGRGMSHPHVPGRGALEEPDSISQHASRPSPLAPGIPRAPPPPQRRLPVATPTAALRLGTQVRGGRAAGTRYHGDPGCRGRASLLGGGGGHTGIGAGPALHGHGSGPPALGTPDRALPPGTTPEQGPIGDPPTGRVRPCPRHCARTGPRRVPEALKGAESPRDLRPPPPGSGPRGL